MIFLKKREKPKGLHDNVRTDMTRDLIRIYSMSSVLCSEPAIRIFRVDGSRNMLATEIEKSPNESTESIMCLKI